ncbi:MAG: class I SAM-dependent methyltransferase [Denitrovibrio sp.]|nr:MAG: class I SAM-dependent methyltransferase [Denitrovibrio sp.]
MSGSSRTHECCFITDRLKMNTNKEILKKVYSAETTEELMEAYGAWAKGYDADLADFGYRAPSESVNLFMKYVPAEAKVIDVGCGTGQVGILLAEQNFADIDGMDYSKEMLEVAGEKSVYAELFHTDITKPLNVKARKYDALICVGTFTYGHVAGDAFERLANIVKSGGYIVFTVREGAYDELNYRDKMVQMEYNKIWELKELVDAVYFKEEEIGCKIAVYRVL